MEYRDEFETRKDVFRVNVFHNKKNGEKVTMYFVPRTTPVNDDTVFDYCTKNKTWREKQAQQWCDEKSGKNKDKLKSLPFVAGGLQRDLKWFGDKATALFDDYKKGLGMTTQSKSNSRSNGNQGDLEALSKLPQEEIVGKFQTRFGISKKDWEQKVTPVGGSSIVSVMLNYKGKQYSGKGSDKRGAQYVAILDFLEKEYGITTKTEMEARKAEAEKRAAEERQAELLDKTKYLRVLSERPDVTVKPTSWINLERPAKGPRIPANNFMIETPYGKQELTSSDIPLAMIKSVKVSAEERKEYNQRIEEDKEDLVKKIEHEKGEEEYWRIYEAQRREEEKKEFEKQQAALRTRELLNQKKREEIENINFSVIKKETNDKDHRNYIIQDDKGSQYRLTIDYGDMKTVDREHHPDWNRYDYGYKTDKVEHQHIEKPMRTLTVAYEKIGGKEDEKFALSAAVEPEVFAKNPLSIDLVLGANLKQTISQKENKDQALMLRKLLKESKDSINASPKKFKEQQTFKER